MPKPAPVPRSELERKVLDGAAKAAAGEPVRRMRAATIELGDDGRSTLVIVDLFADGRWREVRRGEPTGSTWAENQLADEIHLQNMARRGA